MYRLSRLLLVVLLIVCLPVQAAAIASMPFCGGHAGVPDPVASADAGAVVAAANAAVHEHCVQDRVGGKPAGAGSDCDRCVLCHLAGASAVPSVGIAFDESLTSELRAAPSMSPTPFRPDLLDRPPPVSLR